LKVSILGLGYIGLPTAAVLASSNICVVGVDVKQDVVATINQGKIHIVEPGLEVLVNTAVKSGNLRATCQVEKADVFIVAVPTPIKDDKQPDLSFIKSAAQSIAAVLEKGNLIILESTSPVGATEKMSEWMREKRPDLLFPKFGAEDILVDINIAHCPERVLPGNVLHEIIDNERIIGGMTNCCAEKALGVYKLFVQGNCILTDCRTAELSKLVENSFRDVNIAFANELSLICDKLGVNVWNLIKLANLHPRVNILQPGPGVGGHCIAVDPWFVVSSAPAEAKLIRTARRVNDSKPEFVLKKIEDAVKLTGQAPAQLTIACLGVSFKPDIDDLRGSPALDICRLVELMGFKKVVIVEPNITDLPAGCDENRTELVSLNEALEVSEVVVLLVDHSPFKNINARLLNKKQVVDTRGVWANLVKYIGE
jgi:UDP-N-acetyl-D-mannosaminuronic acid dehydrogenase